MKKILVRNNLRMMHLFPDCIYKVPSEIFIKKYNYVRHINHNTFGLFIGITYKK
jgi:hypothetical protein